MQLLTRILALAALAGVLLVGGSEPVVDHDKVRLVHNPPICC